MAETNSGVTKVSVVQNGDTYKVKLVVGSNHDSNVFVSHADIDSESVAKRSAQRIARKLDGGVVIYQK